MGHEEIDMVGARRNRLRHQLRVTQADFGKKKPPRLRYHIFSMLNAACCESHELTITHDDNTMAADKNSLNGKVAIVTVRPDPVYA
jgi:hypothetical protein